MEETKLRSHVKSNVSEVNSFGMKASANSFRILIDGLYQYKILAFVRELGTNAYEAHQLVNKEKTPFSVTLPSFSSPVFKIRDFGPGLTEEQVRKTYTVTFESTKTSDNKFGGGFGLGSKTPFAYSTNFVVTSVVAGKKYMYSFFYDEDGCPSFSNPVITDTEEPSGMEIIIPIKKENFNDVETAVKGCYKYFITLPDVFKDGHKVKIERLVPVIQGKKFSTYHRHTIASPMVRIANIVYPINCTQVDALGLHSTGIILEGEIGEIEPTPSREGISYSKKTIANLNALFKQAKDELMASIQPAINKLKSYHEACCAISGMISSLPLRVDDFSYGGRKLCGSDKITKNFKVKYYNHNGCLVEVKDKVFDRRSGDKFVVIDTKSYFVEAIKTAIPGLNTGRIYICNPAMGANVTEFINEIGMNPSDILYTSSVQVNKTKKAAISHKQKVLQWKYHPQATYSWDGVDVDITVDKGYYIAYHANKIKVGDKFLEPGLLNNIVALIGFTGKVYGVKKDMLKRFDGSPNWENFLDYARPKVYNIGREINPERTIMAAEMLKQLTGQYTNLDYVIQSVRKNVNDTDLHSDFVEYITQRNLLSKYANGTQNNHVLCKNAFSFFYPGEEKNVNGSKPKVPDIVSIASNIRKKYPLLDAVKYYNVDTSVAVELNNYLKGKDKK